MKKDRIQQILEKVDSNRDLQGNDIHIVKDYLIIDTGNGLLAIQIEYLREVLDIRDEKEIAVIPFTPDYIKGIYNLRDEVLPVLYLSRILGMGCPEENCSKLIVIEFKGVKLAFPVQSIVDLKSIDIAHIHIVKDVTKKSAGDLINEEFEAEEQRVGILDVLKFYASEYVS